MCDFENRNFYYPILRIKIFRAMLRLAIMFSIVAVHVTPPSRFDSGVRVAARSCQLIRKIRGANENFEVNSGVNQLVTRCW